MGDRYFLTLHCCKCGAPTEDVYYAPTCGLETFTCLNCETVNQIIPEFTTSEYKQEEKEKDDM